MNDPAARIYELEVYGDGPANLALRRPATSSAPCSADEGPEKAFNGSVTGGRRDRWCSSAWQKFLQVDLGSELLVKRVVIKHASAGGEREELNTSVFNIQASKDNKSFVTIVNGTGARLVDEITSRRTISYFDGQREARLEFTDGKLTSREMRTLLNFEEDRKIFAGVFQFFYLRLAIFFGCLGIFMNLFRGEMLDKTLHFWFLAPARREVLLAGKYGAGLIASTVIFAGGALLVFSGAALDAQSRGGSGLLAKQSGWRTPSGMSCRPFWDASAMAASSLPRDCCCATRSFPRPCCSAGKPSTGFCRTILQKLSVLYYLQSLCPVPAPIDTGHSRAPATAARARRARIPPGRNPGPACSHGRGAVDRPPRHPPHASLLRHGDVAKSR